MVYLHKNEIPYHIKEVSETQRKSQIMKHSANRSVSFMERFALCFMIDSLATNKTLPLHCHQNQMQGQKQLTALMEEVHTQH